MITRILWLASYRLPVYQDYVLSRVWPDCEITWLTTGNIGKIDEVISLQEDAGVQFPMEPKEFNVFAVGVDSPEEFANNVILRLPEDRIVLFPKEVKTLTVDKKDTVIVYAGWEKYDRKTDKFVDLF